MNRMTTGVARLAGAGIVLMRLGLGPLLLSGVVPAGAQDCACGAPCDLLLEIDIAGPQNVTACNTIAVIGSQVLATGQAHVAVGRSVSLFGGFAVQAGGELTVVIDPLLACDPAIDADLDGVDACLDCDESDANNWSSCASCVDDDLDSAWLGCDAYVTLSGPDCDDSDPARGPGATEICNATDDNCDGRVDECLVCF